MAGYNTDAEDGSPVGELDAKIPLAVSDAEGVPVDDLDETLHDATNPTALKKLARSDSTHMMMFDFCGYRVTVHGDETVELEELPDR